ncbi:hypothetical protein B0H10DRAFT_1796504 [Mycena sp. CBHHK59/15]|nr:hypothetical protein B0H10DRAFT_1796504 [Mycena sp. CBHHK59/15]
MKECGTPGVPSFYALRKMQAKLTKDVGLRPQHHTSSLGNQFYMNHPNDLIRLFKDFANPLVRDSIHFYPEITSTVSEFWQASKYVDEVALDELSPMWADWISSPYRHFYIKELAQCHNGSFVVPIKWIIFKKTVHADAYRATQEASGIFTVESQEVLRIAASDLEHNALDIAERGPITFSELRHCFVPHISHPVRATAQGRPVFVLRIMPWADDVSGNRSKQYNAHMNMYFANVNLPHKKLAQEYYIRFCCTSPHASALEQFDALAVDCNKMNWTPAYDCALQREILFRLRAHLLPADNPQQAESSSTSGANSTWWCREDKSGGSDAHRETDEGYDALFGTVTPRTPEETVECIKQQIKAACLGVAKGVETLQTETGVKDKISMHWINLLIEKARQIQQERIFNPETRDERLNDRIIKGEERAEIKEALITEIQEELFEWVIMQPTDRYEKLEPDSDEHDLRPGDHYNVLLCVRGLDPHRDSPCEILHTILLGEDKYVWHETNKGWNDEQGALFADRLQSSSVDGLSIPPLRAPYMVQYKNSLIGKHFKTLQQLAVFHLDEKLCSPQVFNLWKANGELGALIWYPEIKNMEQYLADLQVAIDNVLDHWAIVDPTRIINKFKLHVLPHLPDHVRRFGPSVIFSTEVFECWNAVFRLCSVLSNHQAPSLDIATTLADMERFKHQVSGGWWKAGASESWIQAGEHIRSFLTGNKQLQRRLGWADPASIKPGSAKLMPKEKRNRSTWKEALGCHWSEENSPRGQEQMWNLCKYVVSREGDICIPASWIFFRVQGDAENSEVVIAGRIITVLLPDDTLSTTGSIALVEQFNVSDINDPRLNMPLLLRTGQTRLVDAKDILFKFNAQHDCHHCKCPFAEIPGARQERQASKLKRKVIVHSEDNRFHLNMHALHNAHLIRETLPRHLTEPKPFFTDRRAKHNEFAAVLREIGPAKRAETAAKTQATKQRNKQVKADKLAGAEERGNMMS